MITLFQTIRQFGLVTMLIPLQTQALSLLPNLKLLEDDTVNNSYYGTPYVPMKFVNGGTSSFIYGYEGNEDLYNKLIRTKRDEYKILATDGLYLEN